MKVAEVKKVLIHKGVTELFHVNSVITSLTFINNGGLLSRETVEEYNLPQTDQKSDGIDKKFNIYNDIFFDSVDIHERAKDVNNYGVITFVYSVDVLDEVADYDICILRKILQIGMKTFLMRNDIFLMLTACIMVFIREISVIILPSEI